MGSQTHRVLFVGITHFQKAIDYSFITYNLRLSLQFKNCIGSADYACTPCYLKFYSFGSRVNCGLNKLLYDLQVQRLRS